jgi:hypothetical protein
MKTTGGNPAVRVYILTNEGNASPFSPAWPAASRAVFDRMFSAINGEGNYDKGGLGLNEDDFLRGNYINKPGRFQLASKYVRWVGCGKSWV